MTRYEQGFLTKCAQYGVRPGVASRLLKRATASSFEYPSYDSGIPLDESTEDAIRALKDDEYVNPGDHATASEIANASVPDHDPMLGLGVNLDDVTSSPASEPTRLQGEDAAAVLRQPKLSRLDRVLAALKANKAGVGAGAGAIGAGSIGALLGHVLTRDEKKKKRNAMIAGLVAALAGGAGGYYAGKKVRA